MAWSQEQLAETSGVSVRTIQRIEQGGIASPAMKGADREC
ncbi:helix-turn-helix domain-containing protein [Rhodomicrobium lacus]|nr:helix-turn-helix transcriptional regulator [Rhodomicrobium lacus]